MLLPCRCGLATGGHSPASNHCLLSDSTSTSCQDCVVAAGEEIHTPAVPRRRRNIKEDQVGLSTRLNFCHVDICAPALAVDRVRVCWSLSQKIAVNTAVSSRRPATKPRSKSALALQVFGVSRFAWLFMYTTCRTENHFVAFRTINFV